MYNRLCVCTILSACVSLARCWTKATAEAKRLGKQQAEAEADRLAKAKAEAELRKVMTQQA